MWLKASYRSVLCILIGSSDFNFADVSCSDLGMFVKATTITGT